jgi:hypothetical protein
VNAMAMVERSIGLQDSSRDLAHIKLGPCMDCGEPAPLLAWAIGLCALCRIKRSVTA